MLDTKAIRERAEWAIAYGTHASDVSEGNEEAEQFGRDIVALLDSNAALVEAAELALHKIEQTLAGQYTDGAALRAALDPLSAALKLARGSDG